jgi:hypothetical protein
LQVHRGQGKRAPLAGGLFVHLRHFSCLGYQAAFEENHHSCPVKEMHTPPVELDVDFFTDVLHFDRPKLLRFEVFDAEISIDDEAESRELTRAYGAVSGVWQSSGQN